MTDQDQTVRVVHRDCIAHMKTMKGDSVGQIVTDPPYLINFMNKKWDLAPDETDEDIPDDTHANEAFHLAWLAEAYRVLKPGGVAKVFAATRTMHRLAAAMEGVGFVLEPGNSLEAWAYGSGFPKSLNISKKLDAMAGVQGEVVGTKRGVGGENMNDIVRGVTVRTTDEEGAKGVGAYGTGAKQVAITIPIIAPTSELAKRYAGFGTALKPSWEPFIVGRKPR